ncbi:MAG: nitrogen regulation protein NR(II), partial [Pseudomonadota bacterium]
YINLAAESLLALSGRQIMGAPLGDLIIDGEQDIKDIRAALERGSSFTKRKTELHLVHGRSLTVDYTITPLTDFPGASLLLEIQGMNHAERISREEAMISTHETTRELVRGLAHEIKNPLGGIRGAAQLLASELPDTDLTDYTNVIIEEADRLRKLVDRLMGSGKLPEMHDLNIHEVLERVRSLIEAQIGEQGITITRNYDPSIPPIHGDFEQLIQAVLNIVSNAVESLQSPQVRQCAGLITLKSRVMRNITIGTKFHRLVTRVDIIDNGPGIPPELMDTLFYPMISGRAEGTGLGLSIAHAIVNQHNGIIECKSEPGRTCFSIIIPVKADHDTRVTAS